MEKNKELGELLKQLREKTFIEMGLRRVAKEIDTDYAHLFRIESGQYIPSDETLIKLLEAYKADTQTKLLAFNLARITPEYQKVFDQARKHFKNDLPGLVGAFYRKEKTVRKPDKDKK